jgi:hypothetical protein
VLVHVVADFGHEDLAFAPGSSGWRLPGGRAARRELSLRGGSAWEAFGRPPVESRMSLSVKAA